VYVGSYTRTEGHVDGKADGIYKTSINIETGAIDPPQLAAEVINPSFVSLNSQGNYLYAVSELARPGEPTGYVHAFRVTSGGLEEINKLPTGGLAPCHVAVGYGDKYVIVSNYVGGVAKVYEVQPFGELKAVDEFRVPAELTQTQGSWLHSANFSPGEETVAICDKGLDKVWMFTFNGLTGQLTPTKQVAVDLPTGSGPRHAVWVGDLYLYVINELSNTVTVLKREGVDNNYTILQTISTLPTGYTGESSGADIHRDAGAKYLYASNRGHNSIAIFKRNPRSGLLSAQGHQSTQGGHPRNFAISPNGEFLFAANQNTSNITTFRIDKRGGLLPTGVKYEIPTPVCIEFTGLRVPR